MYKYLLIISLFLSGCYSFKGVSIPQGVDTYYISDVQLSDLDAPANLPITFREAMRRKVRNQSNLKWQEVDPEVEFICNITRYDITTASTGEDATVQLNKFTIAIEVEYIPTYDEDKGWKQSFSNFRIFDANRDFSQVEEGYTDEIFNQITEDIFNKAFAQW